MAFKKKPVLAVDIDEVLARFTPAVIQFHNDNYGSNLKLDDFHSYEFYQVIQSFAILMGAGENIFL